jgi:hypothetical protein
MRDIGGNHIAALILAEQRGDVILYTEENKNSCYRVIADHR